MAGVYRMAWGWREEAVENQVPWLKATAGVQQRDKDGSGPSKAGPWRGVVRKGRGGNKHDK